MENQLGRLAIDALFPRFCVGCEQEGTLWCASCAATHVFKPLSAACPFCVLPGSYNTCDTCAREQFLDGVSAFVPYGHTAVRKALSCWKYDGDRAVESVMKSWIAAWIPHAHLPLADTVIAPVPIHASRKRARGFDQAELIAQWVGEYTGAPLRMILTRTRATASQARTAHTARCVGELDGIFSVDTSRPLPSTVILCDDVFTSGATMDAAARALKEAGVKMVWGCALAKGAAD